MVDKEMLKKMQEENKRIMSLQIGKLERLAGALYKATDSLDALQGLNDFLLKEGAGYDNYIDLDVDINYFIRMLPFIAHQFNTPYPFANVDRTEYKRTDEDL